MKKLLFQFDTDRYPSVFDTVVAYDGGADHVVGHGDVSPGTVASLVQGCIFTRAPKDKKNTAIFIGGSDLMAGQELLKAVKKNFFGDFRVSVMLDSNGSNTTASAAVAKIASRVSLAGKKAVVVGGTGPVGQRAAILLAKEGAMVTITSRDYAKAAQVCNDMKARFNVDLSPVEAAEDEARGNAIQGAQVVIATGATGIQMLKAEHWRDNPILETLADANATPPLGIAGIEMMDRGTERDGKICWGAIGFGSFKLALHRACISKLFEQNNLVLDAEEIYGIAKSMS